MSEETISFSLSVKEATQPPPALVLVDANGNTLADGDSVTLQSETVGVADQQTLFTVSQGVPPYNFSLSSGAKPDGDSLNSNENDDGSETVTLEGTPTTAGSYTFAVTVSDSAGNSATLKAKKAIS